MTDTQRIRSSRKLDVEKRGGPVDVCEHVTIPSAFPDVGHGEYGVSLSIHCDECGETYEFVINVN